MLQRALPCFILVFVVAFTISEAADANGSVEDDLLLSATFIYDGPVGDYGYNYAYDLARLTLMVNYEYNIWCYSRQVNASNYQDTLNTFKSVAATANNKVPNVVIATSIDLCRFALLVAPLFPQTYFLVTGGVNSNASNVAHYQVIMNDARFLTGILAGMKTTANKICFLASFRNSFILGQFNSWVLGARYRNPNVTAMIAFTNAWSNQQVENYATQLMIDAGCDVVDGQVDNISWEMVVAMNGRVSIGFNSDIRLLIGESVLASIIRDFTGIFTQYFDSIINGTFSSGKRYFNMANGYVHISNFGQNVTFSERKLMYNQYAPYVKDHVDTFFCGPIYSSKLCNWTDCWPQRQLMLNDSCISNLNISSFTPFLMENVVDFGTILPEKVPNETTNDHFPTTVVGIVVGAVAAVVLVSIFTIMRVRQHRAAAVLVLKQFEEGQKKSYRIMYNEVKMIERIGVGNFGEVFLAEYRGADVAVKRLKYQNLKKQQIDEFTQEMSIMVGLRHPNIVLLMGACNEPPNLCIITEFMPQGSLYSVLHNERLQFTEATMKNMILDMLKGLQFIHSAGLLHRDLKSPNLLVDKRGNIKLADFGLSVLQSSSSKTLVYVSIPWTAPEILLGQPYTAKADVYSVSVICWEILTRLIPFYHTLPAAIPHAVANGDRPEPLPTDEELPGLVAIIQKCWAQSPVDRPDVTEIRQLVEAIEVEPDLIATVPTNIRTSSRSSMGSTASTRRERSSSVSIVLPKMVAPTGVVSVVFVDVANSNTLWEWDPQVMHKALVTFHQSIELLLFKYRGYLARNDGDAYLLAFSEPIDGINFSIGVHLDLLKQEWPSRLLTHATAQEEVNASNVIWKGLRVRVAAHAGPVHVSNSNADQAHYYGTTVDFVVKVGRLAQPGQTLVTEPLFKQIGSLSSRLLSSSKIIDLHTTPHKIHQVAHNSISARQFTPSFSTLDETAPSLTNDLISKEERWIIRSSDIKIGQLLGTGNYADTFMATYKEKEVVLKVFFVRHVTNTLKLDLRTEAASMSRVSHPNIVEVYGLCLQGQVSLVLEYVERDSLQRVLQSAEIDLPWEKRLTFALGIASGMSYLHSKHILHKDLKPSSLFVTKDWHVKVADLGFSRVRAQYQTTTQSGLVSWTAPEVFEGESYTKRAEVYAFAIILWEIITRQIAWEGVHALRIANMVTQGQRPSISGIVSSHPIALSLVRLMIQCWNPRREERPSFDVIVETLQVLKE